MGAAVGEPVGAIVVGESVGAIVVGESVGAIVGDLVGQHGSTQHSIGHGKPTASIGDGHGTGSIVLGGPGMASPGQLQVTGQLRMSSNMVSGVKLVCIISKALSHVVMPKLRNGGIASASWSQPPLMGLGRIGELIVTK